MVAFHAKAVSAKARDRVVDFSYFCKAGDANVWLVWSSHGAHSLAKLDDDQENQDDQEVSTCSPYG